MTKISQYPILSNPTEDDILIGTDVNNLDETRNFSIASIINLVGDINQGPPGPEGPEGPEGPKGLEWKGEWEFDSNYNVDDAVGFAGSSYICILEIDTNSNPYPDEDPTHWEILAAKGDPGSSGINPNLQQVTDEGFTTFDPLVVKTTSGEEVDSISVRLIDDAGMGSITLRNNGAKDALCTIQGADDVYENNFKLPVRPIEGTYILATEDQIPLRPYNVYTATLTQNGGSSPSTASDGGNVIEIGQTYEITNNGSGTADFTNIGAPNNNIGTKFVATGITPDNWGVTGELSYNNGAPVANVLENTIGNIWFEYQDVGTYNIKSNALFTNNKVFIYTEGIRLKEEVISSILFFNTSELTLLSTNIAFAAGNNLLEGTSIEIRVYN